MLDHDKPPRVLARERFAASPWRVDSEPLGATLLPWALVALRGERPAGTAPPHPEALVLALVELAACGHQPGPEPMRASGALACLRSSVGGGVAEHSMAGATAPAGDILLATFDYRSIAPTWAGGPWRKRAFDNAAARLSALGPWRDLTSLASSPNPEDPKPFGWSDLARRESFRNALLAHFEALALDAESRLAPLSSAGCARL